MEKIGQDAYSLDVNAHCALLVSGRLLLVDTGTSSDGKDLIKEIKSCGYRIDDIEYIILTHTHPDHVGGLDTMKSLTNARIASHEIEAPFISKEVVYEGPPGKEAQRHKGTHVNDLLKDGDIYQGLLVIHTPGHTLGHISLLDRESGLLLAGDSFRTEEGECLTMPDMYNIDPHQHKLSMKKLSEYDFSKTIVGHGNPIHNKAKELLTKASADFK
ncbi:MAG: putative metallo-hydrolase YflN [Candidatus Heimdallarchaeota archaeon LC_3]|nr:MAG: putative metallo-hydrolase YflN [Candidatus Heimdallarchaeota archaeon LC_3]